MAEITGSLISVSPSNGQQFAAGSSVNVKAKGKVTLPAAEGGVQDEYRVTVKVSVYSEETCLTGENSAGGNYTEVFVPRTYTTSEASRTVTGDGGYTVTATLVSEKKKPDGTYEPKVTLDTKTIAFRIGNTGCSPQVHFCTADSPAGSSSSGSSLTSGCTAPVPKPGSTIPPGNTRVSCKVKYAVVGSTTCTRKYKFVVKLEVSGPTTATFTDFTNTGPGLASGSLTPHVALLMQPGDYTATVSMTAQRTDSSKPECSQVKSLGSYSWGWKVASPSSSSSNSPSSSSSSNPSSSSSSNSPSSSSSG
ncbi:MAG: hypothetical protein MI861_28345 [Pirellulales bacterium]|nr:hypothetical protein [Pirellulales bacterium]